MSTQKLQSFSLPISVLPALLLQHRVLLRPVRLPQPVIYQLCIYYGHNNVTALSLSVHSISGLGDGRWRCVPDDHRRDLRGFLGHNSSGFFQPLEVFILAFSCIFLHFLVLLVFFVLKAIVLLLFIAKFKQFDISNYCLNNNCWAVGWYSVIDCHCLFLFNCTIQAISYLKLLPKKISNIELINADESSESRSPFCAVAWMMSSNFYPLFLLFNWSRLCRSVGVVKYFLAIVFPS